MSNLAGYMCDENSILSAKAIKEGDMFNNPSYFVGWGTLSVINAGLAQAKGRSGLLWWLVSLVMGPLATVLIVVLPIGIRRELLPPPRI